ncbi:hypothetical protein G6F68_017786 [Rhizopus microsporus]|nr:hypothetical protein G6F68_017786 [Rhizopus microsporus]
MLALLAAIDATGNIAGACRAHLRHPASDHQSAPGNAVGAVRAAPAVGQSPHRGAADAHAGQHGLGIAGRTGALAARKRPAPAAARQPWLRRGIADAAHERPQARAGTALPHRDRGAGLAGAP